MRKYSQGILYSASDLVNFLACQTITAFDCINSVTPLQKSTEDATSKLLQEKGLAHEKAFLAKLQEKHQTIVEIPQNVSLEEKVRITGDAMRFGADVIYQATLVQTPWLGNADFLIRGEGNSSLGNFQYEVYDTKLARQTSPKFLIQLALYNQLAAHIQGSLGKQIHIVLGTGEIEHFTSRKIDGYLTMSQKRFLSKVSECNSFSSIADLWENKTLPYPIICEKCPMCHWREICEAKRLRDDHLSQVADIRNTQIAKLELAGIKTMSALAGLHEKAKKQIPNIDTRILNKLAQQAFLQQEEKRSGEQQYVIAPPFASQSIPQDPPNTGFALMPPPNEGDLFFDMEGDPLEIGGLEYLFGVISGTESAPEYTSFGAHNREEEKRAFECFIDFAVKRLKDFPRAHIYHYAAYEISAIRRLATRHATREEEVDNLLRNNSFVDLYRVVKNSIFISKDSYSIKKIETFYRDKRAGKVQKGDESILIYEEWKATGNNALIRSIEDYNKEDCISTLQLRNWLFKLAPSWIPAKRGTMAIAQEETGISEGKEHTTVAETERINLEQQLEVCASCKENLTLAGKEVFQLMSHLLTFHIRERKPGWWSLFDRQGAELEELYEDEEIIAACELESVTNVGRSIIAEFRFPAQNFRIQVGDSVKLLTSLDRCEVVNLNEDLRKISIKLSKRSNLNSTDHIVLHSDIPTTRLEMAITKVAQSLVNGDRTYAKALLDYLNRRPPEIHGIIPGNDLLGGKPATPDNIFNVVSNMRETTLYIQGPPGAGKTYTGARLIAALIKNGKKVAICSNSHKVVNNLLESAHDLLSLDKFPHHAVKKVSKDNQRCNRNSIEHTSDDNDIICGLEHINLLGSVVWTFARQELHQVFDYLFVDEAGQVSLANLIAMGPCARNIVLLGDQMQLAQPIQAAHPGRSGDSALDYLLNGSPAIAKDKGIFLDKTFRMHPALCSFVSDCFYESRLLPDAKTVNQRLEFKSKTHPAIKSAGLTLHLVEHKGNTQRSTEEAEEVKKLVNELCGQTYQDHNGKQHELTLQDILIVAPYNAQVNLLSKTLPKGSRVGTVDKFQGQEAPVVIVSMSSSSPESSPRGMGFLLNQNRLNVAISRGKCLTILICSPQLLESPAKTVEDVFRLNVLGRAMLANGEANNNGN